MSRLYTAEWILLVVNSVYSQRNWFCWIGPTTRHNPWSWQGHFQCFVVGGDVFSVFFLRRRVIQRVLCRIKKMQDGARIRWGCNRAAFPTTPSVPHPLSTRPRSAPGTPGKSNRRIDWFALERYRSPRWRNAPPCHRRDRPPFQPTRFRQPSTDSPPVPSSWDEFSPDGLLDFTEVRSDWTGLGFCVSESSADSRNPLHVNAETKEWSIQTSRTEQSSWWHRSVTTRRTVKPS